jgi:hypothetical protein
MNFFLLLQPKEVFEAIVLLLDNLIGQICLMAEQHKKKLLREIKIIVGRANKETRLIHYQISF